MFSPAESDFIKSQRLLRIGTASPEGRPDVAPVAFDFDGEYFYVSGMRNKQTLKYKYTKKNPVAALALDDLASEKPWRPRGIKIFGDVDFVVRDGYAGKKEYLRIKPRSVHSWGLDAPRR